MNGRLCGIAFRWQGVEIALEPLYRRSGGLEKLGRWLDEAIISAGSGGQ